MKHLLIFGALITTIHMNVIAQQDNVQVNTVSYYKLTSALLLSKKNINDSYMSGPEKDHNHYMHQSKTLKIIGLSLLGGGVALGIGGVIYVSKDSYYQESTASTLFLTSCILGVASIPCMVLAHVNKTKAKKLSMASQKTSFNIPGKAEKDIIGLSLSIPIGK